MRSCDRAQISLLTVQENYNLMALSYQPCEKASEWHRAQLRNLVLSVFLLSSANGKVT